MTRGIGLFLPGSHVEQQLRALATCRLLRGMGGQCAPAAARNGLVPGCGGGSEPQGSLHMAMRTLSALALRCASAEARRGFCARPPKSQFLRRRPADASGSADSGPARPRDARELGAPGVAPDASARMPAFAPPPPPPAPVLGPPEPRDFQGSAGVDVCGQYERLRHVLPKMADPGTPRPRPEELLVGTRLRVEWSGSWWAARVREKRGDEVKIGFDTWSAQYDEWLPSNSSRLRAAVPHETDPEEDVASAAASPDGRGSSSPPSLGPAAAAVDSSAGAGILDVLPQKAKPFVPKPFNPEKEFQKRQLRLREKIAAMQKAKVGEVDPDLVAIQERSRRQLEEEGEIPPGYIGQCAIGGPAGGFVPPPPCSPPPGPAFATTSLAKPAAAAATEHVAPTETVGTAKSGCVVTGQAPALDVPAPQATSSSSSSPPQLASDPLGVGRDAGKAALATTHSAGQPLATAVVSKIRWEEVLSGDKERYYHELATGRTQWELPIEGWVQLLDDDGSPYFWDPTTDTTQWTPPQ